MHFLRNPSTQFFLFTSNSYDRPPNKKSFSVLWYQGSIQGDTTPPLVTLVCPGVGITIEKCNRAAVRSSCVYSYEVIHVDLIIMAIILVLLSGGVYPVRVLNATCVKNRSYGIKPVLWTDT